MGKIISIHSFRGGTGKSNSTANLATVIAKTGKRVAIIDTDIQSPGVHVLFRVDQTSIRYTLNDYLWGKCKIEQAALDVTEAAIGSVKPEDERPRLFLIPSSIKTSEIGKIIRDGYDVALLNDGFQELIRILKLDYLLIDTHPGVNEETLLSIAISDVLLLVLRPDSQDFQGTAVTAELARRLDVSKMWMMVNKVPPGMDLELLRKRVESTYGAPVAGMLPLNYEIAQLASNGIFTNMHPDHPFSLTLKRIAEIITA